MSGLARPVLTGLVLLVAAAQLALALSAVWANPHWAEDLTGETDPWQQAKAAVHLARQRPVETADFLPVGHTGMPFIGANTFFEQEVEEWKVRRSMDLLREAGVRWIRQEFPWDRIEPEAKGRFQDAYGSTWATYDRIVALAAEYGIEVVPRLTLPPRWTRRDNSVPRAPPDNYDDYGDFVAAVVERYRGRVRYYQLWNEPNTVLEWGRPPNAADFVGLLRVGYQRAKAADPTVVILGPALSPTIGTPDGANVSDLTFLQEMYDAGAAPYFDIMAAQGYGLWTGPGDRRADPYRTNFARVQLIRQVMVHNGDGHKPIWLAEVGWSALPPDFPGEAIHGRVTEERQARYTLQALRRIRREWPWVGVAFVWHFRRVSDEQRDQADFYFRMVDPDFTLRPVYHAVRQASQDPPALDYGWRPATHWAVQREGQWVAVPSPADGATVTALRAAAPEATLRFAFRGRQLLVYLAPRSGSLEVYLDGARSGRVRAPAGGTAALAATPQLAEGYHQVELRPVGDAAVEVRGFAVLAERPDPVDEAGGALLLWAALATAAAGLWFGGRRP